MTTTCAFLFFSLCLERCSPRGSISTERNSRAPGSCSTTRVSRIALYASCTFRYRSSPPRCVVRVYQGVTQNGRPRNFFQVLGEIPATLDFSRTLSVLHSNKHSLVGRDRCGQAILKVKLRADSDASLSRFFEANTFLRFVSCRRLGILGMFL